MAYGVMAFFFFSLFLLNHCYKQSSCKAKYRRLESHENTASRFRVGTTTNAILVFRFHAPNHPNLIPVIHTPEPALRAMLSSRPTSGHGLKGAVKGVGSAIPPPLHEQRTVIEAVGRLISIRRSI